MRRWIVCVLFCLLLQFAASVLGESPSNPSLLARSGWARFRIVLGRIEVANIHSSQTRTTKSDDKDLGRCEQLTISGDTDIPSVRYERVTQAGVVSIVVIDGNRVEIEKSPSNSQTATVRFRQRPGADVVLQIEDESESRDFRAATVWHLLITYPEVSNTQLLPLLNELNPSWHLDELLADATIELIRQAINSDFYLRRSARKLVTNLTSTNFSDRQESQRKLLQLGVGILPYLNQLSADELTREQLRRLEQISLLLRGKEADSAKRLAMWLVEDERVWLAMLDHDELPMRKIAANHLAKRFARPIDYDPEGAPLERTQQIARLKTRIDRH